MISTRPSVVFTVDPNEHLERTLEEHSKNDLVSYSTAVLFTQTNTNDKLPSYQSFKNNNFKNNIIIQIFIKSKVQFSQKF